MNGRFSVIPGKDVTLEKFKQAVLNQTGCLERDPLSDWQPVEIPQNGRYYGRPM